MCIGVVVTNCPYECRNNCQMFAIRRVIFYLFAITFFPAVKLHVFGYWTFVDLLIFTAVDKVKDGILYNKVWKDNWTYWDTCQYYTIHCSIGTIWVHFKRNYNLFDQVLMLLLLYCFLFIWMDRNYFLLQAWPKLTYLWSHERFMIYWLKIKHIIFII